VLAVSVGAGTAKVDHDANGFAGATSVSEAMSRTVSAPWRRKSEEAKESEPRAMFDPVGE